MRFCEAPAALQTRRHLVLKNLALRHQLLVLNRTAKTPALRNSDRLFWHWKSRRRTGRSPTDRDLIELIRRMWQANPTWGSPRRAELAKLGLQVSAATVRKYRPKGDHRPPSQTWRAFLRNHASQLIAVDFFTVPTVTFRVLFVFVVLAHERRRVLHIAVTESPSASWAGQQVVNAFPFEVPPKYLLRDRDGIYGAEFAKRMAALGIEEKLIAPHAPWQNPYAERLIGSLRRECLDHVIILNERHLKTVLREYVEYYHRHRTHLSLERDCPVSRAVESAGEGKVIEMSMVGGLHHRYTRQAA